MDSVGMRGILASSSPRPWSAAGGGPATGRVGQAATRPGDTCRALRA